MAMSLCLARQLIVPLLVALCGWQPGVGVGATSISLDDANGQHLIFLRLAINAAVLGPFALVENEMVFQNPESRRMEGRFKFALPTTVAGQAMPSRFAMEIQGNLMEGEVVNKSKAQKVFREILHEARDPALLEQGQGNIFTAKVFPIEPNAVVRLVLAYTLTVPLRALRREVVLPLAGLPELHHFKFSAVVGSLGEVALDANCSAPGFGRIPSSQDGAAGLMSFAAEATEAMVPETDLVIEVSEAQHPSGAYSVDGGRIVSLFSVPEAPGAAAEAPFLPATWSIYVDTSASTADTAVARAPLLAALLDAMPSAAVEVFAFDIEVAELRALGPKDDELGAAVRQAVEDRLSLGATDLDMLLAHVGARPAAAGQHGVLILSDAIPTASERAAMKLGSMLASRTDLVVELGVIGSKFDIATGAAIAAGGNGRVVRIPLTSRDVAAVASAAWADLTRPMGRRATPVASSGWAWPEATADVHGGDEVIVFSGGAQGLATQPPELQLGSPSTSSGVTVTVGGVQVAGASFSSLLAREATRARLELLESSRQLAGSASSAKELEFQIVQLSEQSRVMCPHTALLVLETEADYARFGIDRDTLSPILGITPEGVQLQQRSDIVLPALPAPVSVTATTTAPTTNANESSDDPPDQAQDEADEWDRTSEGTAPQQTSSGTRLHVRPGLGIMMLLLLACSVGCGSEATWADLEADAATVLGEHGPEGPQERLRDVAARYAGALWAARDAAGLRGFCARWLSWDPANGLAYEYLGKAAGELDDHRTALRAVTSIAEVAPRDPEQLLRGSWVAMTLTANGAQGWAHRFAARSLDERQDNPNTYRALALAAWRGGNFSAAAQVYMAGVERDFHGRYGDVRRVLREEAAVLRRSLAASQQESELPRAFTSSIGASLGRDIRLRITMSWLTDANDVDLHVIDPSGEECFYGHKTTQAGLELYSDQTQGLGPEVIVLNKHVPGAYRIGVKYFSSGAMGASRGTVVIWRLVDGVPQGPAQVEPFTLPAGYSSVLPVATVDLE